ncbi:MAG TPA: STAS domain-containing protein [Tepidisphaeraceae bacterium]|nr:STAS domain-containing protein [Tepidisphaeraceae bacterium]
MAETTPPVAVSSEKDVRIVEFVTSKVIDELSIVDIGQSLAAIIEERPSPKLLLDFSRVEHLSSAALGMLINVNTRIKAKNGQLRLCQIKPQIYEVFLITHLNKLFYIHPTRQEALASFT